MSDKKRWSEIITKSILENEYFLGKSWKSIAQDFGCGETTVMRLALKYEIKSRKRDFDLLNKRFGKLLVTKKELSNKRNDSMWNCICDCGKETVTMGRSLVTGATKSCGCFVHEKLWKGYKEISGTYWGRCGRGAKIRGLDFNITIEEAWQKFIDQNRKCALSGRILKFNPQYCNPRSDMQEWQTASLDRVNSDRGYLIDNIQWVDVSVNYMKNDMIEDEFINLCKSVLEYNGYNVNKKGTAD